MSSLAALTGMGAQGGFQQDIRFALPGSAIPHALAEPVADAPDPVAASFADGYAAGVEHAQTVAAQLMAEEAEARAALDLSFVRLDAEMAEGLRQRLSETVMALCEATLVPFALDTDVLQRRVERAVSMLSRAEDERVIRLNPEDMKLVSPRLPQDWKVVEDASLPRGSLRVETATGGVEDGPLQWRAALAEALESC